MDLSALIFVALAVAWAVYLIPKALRHHEDSTASRTVDGFSDRLRVLARREPVGRTTSRLVVSPGRATSTTTAVAAPRPEPVAPVERPVPVAARRAAAARAARRRLRVVLTILLAGVAVGVLAGLGHVAWPYLGLPGGALLAWLVACRLMVRKERAAVVPTRRLPIVIEEPLTDDEGPLTDEVAAVLDEDDEPAAEPTDPEPAPGGWDPVPTTLPTYVGKEPAARRTVRTIDLDSTGVWSSGFSASDSALAREAEESERAARAITRSVEEKRRASGT